MSKLFRLYNNIEEYYDINRRLNKPTWAKNYNSFVNFVAGIILKDISKELKGQISIDTHVHTNYSHCCFDTLERILIEANKIGLSGICIMDHHTLFGYKKALKIRESLIEQNKIREDFLIIPGIEYGTKDGHVGAMFVDEDIKFQKYSAKEAVDIIHDIGGIAVAVHPYRKKTGVKDLVFELAFDAIEAYSGSIAHREYAAKNLEAAYSKNAENMAKLGSSDSHFHTTLGTCYTVFPENTKTLEDVKNAITGKKTIAKESSNYEIEQKIFGKIKW